MHKIHLASLGT